MKGNGLDLSYNKIDWIPMLNETMTGYNRGVH